MKPLRQFAREYVPWDVKGDSLGLPTLQPHFSFAAAPAFHSTWERWRKGTELGSKINIIVSGTDQTPLKTDTPYQSHHRA